MLSVQTKKCITSYSPNGFKGKKRKINPPPLAFGNKYLFNIDWLQLNCRHVSGFSENMEVKGNRFKLKTMDRGTSLFKLWQELYFNGKREITILRHPHKSSVLPKEMIYVKIDNSLFYRPHLKETIATTLGAIGLKLHNISRIDFSVDFQTFNMGLNPEKFICKLVMQEYLKFGDSLGNCVFRNKHRGLEFQYLAFGSKSSFVRAYLYNKSKELKQLFHKDYIRQWWLQNGMDETNGDVWRLEMSLKNGKACVANLETGEGELLNNWNVLNPELYTGVMYALINKYWRFCHEDISETNKSRLRKVSLFPMIKDVANFSRYITDLDQSKSDIIFVRKIEKLNDELRILSAFKDDPEIDKAIAAGEHYQKFIMNKKNIHHSVLMKVSDTTSDFNNVQSEWNL